MQDLLKEISGTMARTSQKRKAMLNVYEREQWRRAHAAMFAPRPANPADCTDPAQARQFLHSVQRELNHRLAVVGRMALDPAEAAAPPSKPSADSENGASGSAHVQTPAPPPGGRPYDSAAAVREANAAANRLLREREKWARRVAALRGGDGAAGAAAAAPAGGVRFTFFGAAKALPEAAAAAAAAAKRPRDADDGDDGDDSADSGSADETALGRRGGGGEGGAATKAAAPPAAYFRPAVDAALRARCAADFARCDRAARADAARRFPAPRGAAFAAAVAAAANAAAPTAAATMAAPAAGVVDALYPRSLDSDGDDSGSELFAPAGGANGANGADGAAALARVDVAVPRAVAEAGLLARAKARLRARAKAQLS